MSKIPPPPPIASQDPTFNRWLLELTSILNSSGLINPDNVDGLSALQAQSNTNTTNIGTLQTTTTNQEAEIAALANRISTNEASITTINGQITTLQGRAQVYNGTGAPAAGLGSVNDWYANVGGAVGARLYIKTAPTVWTAFPF